MKKIALIALTGAAILTLAACEKTKEQFDFSKRAPDEFAVVRRAPLEIPPDFKSLPAPRPGAPRPQEAATDKIARQAILGEAGIAQSGEQATASAGEAALLQKTGAANASPAIRAKVDAETAEIIKDARPGIDKLKEMIGETPAEPAPEALDPKEEIERLRKTGAAAKPAVMDSTGSRKD